MSTGLPTETTVRLDSTTVKATEKTSSNLVPSPPLEGSQYSGRLAYTENFQEDQIITERIASLSVSEQRALGYSLPSMLLECTYAGVACDQR